MKLKEYPLEHRHLSSASILEVPKIEQQVRFRMSRCALTGHSSLQVVYSGGQRKAITLGKRTSGLDCSTTEA